LTDKQDQGSAPAADAAGEKELTDEQIWDALGAEEAEGSEPVSSDDEPGEGDDDTGAVTDDGSGEGRAPDQSEQGDDDIWKDVPDTVRERYASVEEKARRSQGQVSGLQRKINDLTRQLNELQSGYAQAGPTGDGKMTGDELSQLEDEYPEVVGPMAKVLRQTQNELREIKMATLQQQERTIEAEERTFLQEHADGFDVVQNDHVAFEVWVEDQPKRLRDAYATNRAFISDGKAAAELVSAYKTYLGKTSGSTEQRPGQGQHTDELSRRRQLQIEGARSVSQKGQQTAIQNAPPEGASEEDYWNYWARKEQAR